MELSVVEWVAMPSADVAAFVCVPFWLLSRQSAPQLFVIGLRNLSRDKQGHPAGGGSRTPSASSVRAIVVEERAAPVTSNEAYHLHFCSHFFHWRSAPYDNTST